MDEMTALFAKVFAEEKRVHLSGTGSDGDARRFAIQQLDMLRHYAVPVIGGERVWGLDHPSFYYRGIGGKIHQQDIRHNAKKMDSMPSRAAKNLYIGTLGKASTSDLLQLAAVPLPQQVLRAGDARRADPMKVTAMIRRISTQVRMRMIMKRTNTPSSFHYLA